MVLVGAEVEDLVTGPEIGRQQIAAGPTSHEAGVGPGAGIAAAEGDRGSHQRGVPVHPGGVGCDLPGPPVVLLQVQIAEAGSRAHIEFHHRHHQSRSRRVLHVEDGGLRAPTDTDHQTGEAGRTGLARVVADHDRAAEHRSGGYVHY